MITTEGLFKVDTRNENLEGCKNINLNNEVDPYAYVILDKEKIEFKEYIKEAVQYRDELELVEKISSKQFAYKRIQALGSCK